MITDETTGQYNCSYKALAYSDGVFLTEKLKMLQY